MLRWIFAFVMFCTWAGALSWKCYTFLRHGDWPSYRFADLLMIRGATESDLRLDTDWAGIAAVWEYIITSQLTTVAFVLLLVTIAFVSWTERDARERLRAYFGN